MKGRAISYSAAEMAWLEENRLMVISDYHRAFVAAFKRDDVSLVNLHSLRKRKSWSTGRTGCFPKGNEPFNKGKPMPYNVNSAATRFQKGSRTGKAALNWKPVGTERISQDGYREIKVHEGLPMQSRWQLLHRVEWEKVNGSIPPDHALKCLDGDRANVDPSNWDLVSRAVLARLSGGRHRTTLAFDDASPEVKPLVMAIAKLKERARAVRA
jgi:hypothetical protein